MKVIFVSCLCVLANLSWAGQWVKIDLTADSGGYEKVGSQQAVVAELGDMPQVELSWYDRNNVLIVRERQFDPRAVWPLMDEGGGQHGHASVILLNKKNLRFKKPTDAVSLRFRYLNTDLVYETKKISFP